MSIFVGTTEYNILDLGFDKNLSKFSSSQQDFDNVTPELANIFSGGISPKTLTSGETSESISVVNKYIQSSNFVSGSSGWRADSDGNIEAQNVIARGDFHRNDYHWVTFLESLDGFDATRTTISSVYVTLETGAIINQPATIQKIPTYMPDELNWNENRKIRTKIYFVDTTNQTIYVVSGGSGVPSEHIGFKIVNDTIYGSVSNGSIETNTSSLQTISPATAYSLEAVKIGNTVSFFIDGTKQGELSSGLPTGTSLANRIIVIDVNNDAAAIKTIRVSFWDFWQAVN